MSPPSEKPSAPPPPPPLPPLRPLPPPGYPPLAAPDYVPMPGSGLLPEDLPLLKNHTHALVYVWLADGTGLWVFPLHHHRRFLCGYLWEDGRWRRGRIALADVVTYF